jgi:phosphonate transport system ATP-binding protein
MNGMPPFLRLENVTVRYNGPDPALRTTSIGFRQGEFAVLLGPSGAGKSTLLRCLNGLVTPTDGAVSVEGLGTLRRRDVLRRHRLRTAMIFQRHQLIPRHTALKNVLLGRLGHHGALRSLFPLPDSDRRIALQSLDRVGLLRKALERVDALSGGEQQRIGIARALAQRPAVILADEPVASLDPANADRILALLKGICRDGEIAAVVSLHQVGFALRYADRIVGLSRGQVTFDDSPAKLSEGVLEGIYCDADGAVGDGKSPEAGAFFPGAFRSPGMRQEILG